MGGMWERSAGNCPSRQMAGPVLSDQRHSNPPGTGDKGTATEAAQHCLRD